MNRLSLVLSAVALLSVPQAVHAGPNPNAVVAMHTVVTDSYLYCETAGEWCPDDCFGIDNSALEGEIAPGGWGYADIVFLIYNFNAISAVEFAVGGWPTTRGVPSVPEMTYCPVTSTVFGNPWDGVGGAIGFGGDITSSSPMGDVYCFAFGVFNMYNVQSYWPLELGYIPANYTTPTCTKIAGPAPDYLSECVSGEHGCMIGGVHSEAAPYADCQTGPACPADGDVDEDGSVTAADAFCAFGTYLENQTCPTGCINDCCLTTADVDCSAKVTPADALCIYKDSIDPGWCIPDPPCNVGGLTVPRSREDRTPGVAAETKGGVIVCPQGGVYNADVGDTLWIPILVTAPAGVEAFGMELTYPTGILDFVRVDPTALTQTWTGLGGNEYESGSVLIGGFNVTGLPETSTDAVLYAVFVVTAQDEGQLCLDVFDDDFAGADPCCNTFTIEPPFVPELAVEPDSLFFAACEGGADPDSQWIGVWNAGTGTLAWTASEGAGWLSINPTAGQSAGEVDTVWVSVDIAGLLWGYHWTQITVEDVTRSTPQYVDVILEIGPPCGSVVVCPLGGDFYVEVGDTVKLPVVATAPAGINTFGMDLTYPTGLLTFVRVDPGEPIQGWDLTANEDTPGTVTIAASNPPVRNGGMDEARLLYAMFVADDCGPGEVCLDNFTGDFAWTDPCCDMVDIQCEQCVPIDDLWATAVGTSILLEWTEVMGATAYNVYRDTDPYFAPDQAGGSNRIAELIGDEDPGTDGVQWTDTGNGATVVGDPNTNYFYVVTACCSPVKGEEDAVKAGYLCAESAPSNRVGEFDYQFTTTAATDVNEMAMPLDTDYSRNPIHTPEDLCTLFPCVTDVYRWDAPGQGTVGYVCGLPFHNFDIALGMPFMVNAVGAAAPCVVTITGAVRDTFFCFITTDGTDYNHFSIPLGHWAESAQDLCDDIGCAEEILVWDAAAQDMMHYVCSMPARGFGVEVGYPYYMGAEDPCCWPVEEGGRWFAGGSSVVPLPVPAWAVPHTAYGIVENSDATIPAPGDIEFETFVTTRPGEVLTHESLGCGYDGGHFFVAVANFPTAWAPGEMLKVVIRNPGICEEREVTVILTVDGSDYMGLVTLQRDPTHTAFGTVHNSDGTVPADGEIQFEAYITDRPGEVLTQASPGCGYQGGTWTVTVGGFPTVWSPGETLYIHLTNANNGEEGEDRGVLTCCEADDFGDTSLCDRVPPSAVQNLQVLNRLWRSIIIVWDANPEDDISHYVVYRGPLGGDMEPVNEVYPPDPLRHEDEGISHGRQGTTGDLPGGAYQYYVTAVDICENEGPPSNMVEVGLLERWAPLTSLKPNPANPSTDITCALPMAGNLSVEIYNVRGQRVRTVVDGEHTAGMHTFHWDGTDFRGQPVASGVYFCRVEAGGQSVTERLLVVK